MKHWKSIAATVIVMLGLPWAAVRFAPGDAGMAICFVLFYALNPIYAVAVGILAGRDLKKQWFQPMVTAALFLLGTWLLFDMGEPAFVRYALVYLGLGAGAMGVSCLLKK